MIMLFQCDSKGKYILRILYIYIWVRIQPDLLTTWRALHKVGLVPLKQNQTSYVGTKTGGASVASGTARQHVHIPDTVSVQFMANRVFVCDKFGDPPYKRPSIVSFLGKTLTGKGLQIWNILTLIDLDLVWQRAKSFLQQRGRISHSMEKKIHTHTRLYLLVPCGYLT